MAELNFFELIEQQRRQLGDPVVMTDEEGAAIREATSEDARLLPFQPPWMRPRSRKRRMKLRMEAKSVPLGVAVGIGVFSPQMGSVNNQAWSGTLEDLFAMNSRDSDGLTNFDCLVDLMMEDRRVQLPLDQDGEPQYDAFPAPSAVAHLITLGDLEDLLDDPNVWVGELGNEPEDGE